MHKMKKQKLETATFPVTVDISHADRSFDKYGHVLAPLLRNDPQALTPVKTKQRAWFHFTPNKTTYEEAFKDWLPISCTFYPNEEVDSQIDHVLGSPKLNAVGLRRFGDTKYNRDARKANWMLVSDEEIEIVNSYQQNDTVQVGAAIRNGINADTSLGIDLFTFRGICTNGAVLRDRSFGSINIYHIGDFKAMSRKFEDGLLQVMNHSRHIVRFYQAAQKIRMTQKIAELIFKKVPIEKLMPQYIRVVDVKKGEVKLTNDNVSVWQTFNDITRPLTSNMQTNRIGFSNFSWNTTQLHKVLIAAVQTQAVAA